MSVQKRMRKNKTKKSQSKKVKTKKIKQASPAKASKKKVLSGPASKKNPPNKNRLKKMANKISQTTKKMVDEVLLKLIGNRVLERAQTVSAGLKKEKNPSNSKKFQED